MLLLYTVYGGSTVRRLITIIRRLCRNVERELSLCSARFLGNGVFRRRFNVSGIVLFEMLKVFEDGVLLKIILRWYIFFEGLKINSVLCSDTYSNVEIRFFPCEQ